MTKFPNLQSIVFRDKFWLAWQKEWLDFGLLHQYEMLKTTGRLQNFELAARGANEGHQGYIYNDSDVYKWLEAACYALHHSPNWSGKSLIDQTISLVAAAQDDSGYIGTPFQIGQQNKRWTALTSKHEMYCIGHLIEATVAHFEVTGERDFLAVGIKAAEHVCATFGEGKKLGYCGHQEIELALCRLSEVTGQEKYRDLARWMILRRGHRPSPFVEENSTPEGQSMNQGYDPLIHFSTEYDGTYFQDDRPLSELTVPSGHAVRAMYYYCGALDSGVGEPEHNALLTIWSNLVNKRMYVTGGIGSAGRNEGFTFDYDLPNREAYAETCAAIGLVFWASRMSRTFRRSEFADVLELALYNAVLSGVNLKTDRYFYENPLESLGDRERKPWFGCACCPPNIARLILSVQKYACFASDGEVTIDLPIAGEYGYEVGKISIESNWPWSGVVSIQVEPFSPMTIRVRIPSWCEQPRLPSGTIQSDGYAVIEIDSKSLLEFDFPMVPDWQYSHPLVNENIDRICLKNGPLIYCYEEIEEAEKTYLFRADPSALIHPRPVQDPRLALSFNISGTCIVPDQSDLYSPKLSLKERTLSAQFVPYFSWSNNGKSTMNVWVKNKKALVP